MRYLFALLMTAENMVVTLAVYGFVCWAVDYKMTLTGFMFVLIVNFMIQFYYEILED